MRREERIRDGGEKSSEEKGTKERRGKDEWARAALSHTITETIGEL